MSFLQRITTVEPHSNGTGSTLTAPEGRAEGRKGERVKEEKNEGVRE